MPGVATALARSPIAAVVAAAVLAAAAAPGASPAVRSDESHLAIIVNRANPLDDLSLSELRKIFRAGRSRWDNGRRITLVMQEKGQAERGAALRLIYGMTESEFNRYFLQVVFTGEVPAPPRTLSTPAGVRRFVFNVPGAIGYVRAEDADETVKALRVDGHAPGETGYRLTISPP